MLRNVLSRIFKVRRNRTSQVDTVSHWRQWREVKFYGTVSSSKVVVTLKFKLESVSDRDWWFTNTILKNRKILNKERYWQRRGEREREGVSNRHASENREKGRSSRGRRDISGTKNTVRRRHYAETSQNRRIIIILHSKIKRQNQGQQHSFAAWA